MTELDMLTILVMCAVLGTVAERITYYTYLSLHGDTDKWLSHGVGY